MAAAPVVSFPVRGHAATFVVSEANGHLSREQGRVAAGSGKVVSGLIMGKVTATGKFVPLASGASDGSQNFAGICWEDKDATTEDRRMTFFVRSGEVQRAALSFAGTPNDSQKNAVYAQMAALHIALR